MSGGKSVPLTAVLPGSWGAAPDGRATVLRIDGGQAVLARDGREMRLAVADGDVLHLLHAALAVHAGVAVPAWPGADAGAVGARDARLHRRLRPGKALAASVAAGLHQVLGNARGAASGHVEATHQARAGLRRLRTALVLFQPLLRPDAAARLRDELGPLGRVLGAARDWDVFCLEVLPGLPDEVASGAERLGLQDAAEQRRRAAHAEVARLLAPPGAAALAAGVAGWVAAELEAPELEAPGTRLAEGRLGRVAADLLSRLERKVRRRARHIDRRSDADLHALRKATKKLRYGGEFLRPLFRPKAVTPYLKACEALQARLGEGNDLVNAARMARELAGAPGVAGCAASVAGWLDQQASAASAASRAGWRTFEGATPFWG